EHLRTRERIEERALARVGVADQGHRRHGHGLAPLPLLLADPAHSFEIKLELIDTPLNPPAVGFKLRLARSASADAAAELGHGFAPACQPRQQVLKLGELYLELTFPRPGVPGKDVEDELRAVENAAGKRSLQVAELRGRKIVIEEDEIGVSRSGDPGNLFHLAGADQRGWVRPRTPLQQLCNHLSACACNQLAKLG